MIQFEYLTLLVVHTKSFKDREQKGGGGEGREGEGGGVQNNMNTSKDTFSKS